MFFLYNNIMLDLFKIITSIVDVINILFNKLYFIFGLHYFTPFWKPYYSKCQIFLSDIGYYVGIFFPNTTYRFFFIIIILFCLFKKKINKFLIKNLKKPNFVERWHKKGEFEFHVIKNDYMYGGATHERKYDREAFAVEEQIFQQCVSPRALINRLKEKLYNRRY